MNAAVSDALSIATVLVPILSQKKIAPAVRSKSPPSLERKRLTSEGSHNVSRISTRTLLNAMKVAGRMYRSMYLLSG